MQTYGLEKRLNTKNCPQLMVKKLKLKRNHISRKKYARQEARTDIQRCFNDYMLTRKGSQTSTRTPSACRELRDKPHRTAKFEAKV